jgi:hypothetical protein
MNRRTCVLAVLLAGTTTAALHADWIVTHKGEKFEIQGAYQVKGKLVVFTLPDGKLSSMRASAIDFDASQQATDRAAKDAAAPPATDEVKSKRKSVIVLTDKDFQKTPAVADTPPAAPGKDAKDAAEPGKPINRDAVEIVGWDRVPAAESKADGAEITGVLRNTSQNILTEVTVVASLYDDTGNIIAKIPATVDNQALPPNETSKFHLVAKGVFAFTTLKFDTQWKGVKSKAAPAGGAPTSGTGTPAAATPPPTPPTR